jgi:hypothetical protein
MTEAAQGGNRIWLVCSAHPDTASGIMIGQRRLAEYFKAPSAGQLNDWFEKHHACDPNPDHYKLAYSQTLNWDKHKPVGEDSVPLAVRLSIVKSQVSADLRRSIRETCECGCIFPIGDGDPCRKCGRPPLYTHEVESKS